MAHLDLMAVGQEHMQDATAWMQAAHHDLPAYLVISHGVYNGPIRIEDFDVLGPDVGGDALPSALACGGPTSCRPSQSSSRPSACAASTRAGNRLGTPMISATCGLAG